MKDIKLEVVFKSSKSWEKNAGKKTRRGYEELGREKSSKFLHMISKFEKKIIIRKLTRKAFQKYIAFQIWDHTREIVMKNRNTSHRQVFFTEKSK